MSRAFVKETDETFESLPDRPISAHQNLVTPEGLELIEAALAHLRQERALAQSANDRAARGVKLGGDRGARLTAKARAAGRAVLQAQARSRASDLASTRTTGGRR